ncbi:MULTISPECIES: response regulator [Myxococcus]|uniref:response regulator n=1 Tax=Myxococcus TaxID=32 RepID=UPI0013D10441|nr:MULTISPECIES: response regulator [Myxococcus]NVJ23639.1 response regulator [Myxococcus sp. AM011]
MKVLLVEDDASLREGMGELISDLAEVRSVGDVSAALAALGEERFELVVTDLRIGGGEAGGRSVLEAARKGLQAVAIVSAAAPEEVARALRPSVPDGVLVKPFQIEDILGLVERFLAVHRNVELASRGQLPAEGDWVQCAPGVHLASPGGGAGGAIWVRMAAQGQWDWAARARGREAALLLEGELEFEGTRFVAPATFFVGADETPEARTPTGCLVITLGLDG